MADPNHATAFLQPSACKKVNVGSKESLVWTVAYVSASKVYDFVITPLKAGAVGSSTASHASVAGAPLIPVADAETESSKCGQVTLSDAEAEETPCSFQHYFTFASPAFAVGDLVVMQLQWKVGSKTHVLYSPPYEVVSEAAKSRSVKDQRARRLWDEADWNQRLSSNQEACDAKDLNFDLDWGCQYKASMKQLNAHVLPMLGDFDKPPELTTGLENVAGMTPGQGHGQDMKKLLPSWLCKGGLCSGTLPTCKDADFKKMHFPELTFHFNRPFRFGKHAKGAEAVMRNLLAYAFSVLPEAVDVMIHRAHMNSTFTTFAPLMQPATTPPPTQANLEWPGLPDAGTLNRPDSNPRNSPFAGDSQRRLRSTEPTAVKESIQGRTVHMRFKKGFPMLVDRKLVSMMVRHGMFSELYDEDAREKGPAFITDFEVNSDEPGLDAHQPLRSPWLYGDDAARRAGAQLWRTGLAIVSLAAGIVILSSTILVAVRVQKHRRQVAQLDEALE